jgi:hypothetical protein
MGQLRLSQVVKAASRLLDERAERAPTGIGRLDLLLAGGFPKGKISEVAGEPSSGKTSVVFSTLSQATFRGEPIAYIDSFDVFDPLSAAQAGIELDRLLWVRCGASLEKASVAADIAIRSGSFGVVALDLAAPDEGRRHVGRARIPAHNWFRFKQALEGSKTALVAITLIPTAGSAAALVVNLQRTQTRWRPEQPDTPRQSLRRPGFFKGLVFEAGISRGKGHGCVTLHCDL